MKAEPSDREHYDYRWTFYPFEHPAAYWLRSDGDTVLCTRCGGMFSALRDVDLATDPAPAALAFSEKHLACPLGYGVNGIGKGASAPPDVAAVDPIFL